MAEQQEGGNVIVEVVDTAINIIGSLFGGGKSEDEQRLDSFNNIVAPVTRNLAAQQGVPVYAFWYGLVIGMTPGGQREVVGRLNTTMEMDSFLANLAAQRNTAVINLTDLNGPQFHLVSPILGSGTTGIPGGTVQTTSGISSSGLLLAGGAALAAFLLLKRK